MGMLLAVAMPERINALAMLDALLPHAVEVSDTAEQLRKFLIQQRRASQKQLPRYDSIDEAISARCKAVNMREPTARMIVERGLVKVGDQYQWVNDPRLTAASAFKLTMAHNHALLESLTVPSLLLMAEQGIGGAPSYVELVKRYGAIETMRISGGHHFHMEEQAATIAEAVQNFLTAHQCSSGSDSDCVISGG
jgi:pimeloyl-ACP methyl ester carboxylesterase